LQNDGLRTASSTAILTLDPTATGEYQVLLKTYDDQGQASLSWANLKIYAE